MSTKCHFHTYARQDLAGVIAVELDRASKWDVALALRHQVTRSQVVEHVADLRPFICPRRTWLALRHEDYE